MTFVFQKLGNATSGVSKDNVLNKINELNSGILNSNNVPSHFTASQCMNMGFLATEISGYENELKTSIGKKRIKEIYKALKNVEKKAKNISKRG